MIEKYNDINTPEELLDFMSNNIEYGFLGKDGSVFHYFEEDFNDNFFTQYVLERADDVVKNKVGNCWDQVELERDWFLKHNYEIKTIYEMVLLDYENSYPTHTFLVYKDHNKWYWFENADFDNRGIHEFNSFDELISYQLDKYKSLLNSYNITSEEINHIIMTEYNKPNDYINCDEFIDHVVNSKKLDIFSDL